VTSSITRASVKGPGVKGLFLFQTPSQFLLFALIVGVLYVVVSWLPYLNAGARSGALTGGVSATIAWLVFDLPARIEWHLASPNARVAAYAKLAGLLDAMGYSDEFEAHRFRLGLPPWARGDWNVVRVEPSEACLVVTGPLMVIRRLRRQLLDEV
jgi:hypothetical protein